jgi:PAS domain S-box-containing protein
LHLPSPTASATPLPRRPVPRANPRISAAAEAAALTTELGIAHANSVASERQFRALFERTPDAIVVADDRGRYIDANPAASILLGLTREQLLGRRLFADLVDFADDAQLDAGWQHFLKAGEASGEVRLLRPDGTVRFVEYTATATVVPGRHFGILRDLTERRSKQQLALQRARIIEAFHRMQPESTPELTAEALCAEITRHSEAPNAAIFAFEDDGTMTTLASSIAARPSADLPHTITDGRATHLRDRAAQGAWFETFRGSDDGALRAWLASIGITTVAFAPIEVGGEILGLLTVGDGTALLEEPDMLEAVVDFAALASSLLGGSLIERRRRRADAASVERIISTGAFHPVFQPILDLGSGAVIGYEALTRFDSGVTPEQVFGAAAGCEQGIPLEVATIGAALAAARRLPDRSLIHINVSPALILEREALARLLACPGLQVVLEVTEHEQVADYGELRAAVRGLGSGIRIAVDDAGAGFASLRHILELQPDVVKLDRGLVAGIDHDPARQALVAGLVHFADGIGALLVGEGIETEGELETLKRLGARAGQGFLLGRPVPAPGSPTDDPGASR